MIAVLLPPLLGLGLVASALWAAFARTRAGCLWALSLNGALLAATAWTMDAPLMGIAWMLSALGLALAAGWIGRGGRLPTAKATRGRLGLALCTALMTGLVLFAVLIAVDSPIWWGDAPPPVALAERMSALAEGLTGRYAPGLAAIGLLALTLLVGVRLWEEA